MEQIGNRISFVKGYTKTEKIAINTKIDRILKGILQFPRYHMSNIRIYPMK